MRTPLYVPLSGCRICQSSQLESILNFGEIAFTGIFLQTGSDVSVAPMVLGRCQICGLVQLLHSYDSQALYGSSYGYESHLNGSMREHLKQKAEALQSRYLGSIDGAVIVDIASNDGYLLSCYSSSALFIGIDPLISNFENFYPEGAIKISNFFSAETYFHNVKKKANLVTSLSVLYDLHDPIRFASDVSSVLEDEGIWHFEQSYLPSMVETLSYDTICHEHLTYLRFSDIQLILRETGFKILNVELNSINGGSIAVTAIKTTRDIELTPYARHLERIESEGYKNNSAILEFAERVKQHRIQLNDLIEDYRASGYEIVGLGASTKGNVLLQFLGFSELKMRHVGEVNPKKYGKQTPGTGIPIVPEEFVLSETHNRSLILVLPWHFRQVIIENCKDRLADGAKLLFAMPQIEVIDLGKG